MELARRGSCRYDTVAVYRVKSVKRVGMGSNGVLFDVVYVPVRDLRGGPVAVTHRESRSPRGDWWPGTSGPPPRIGQLFLVETDESAEWRERVQPAGISLWRQEPAGRPLPDAQVLRDWMERSCIEQAELL